MPFDPDTDLAVVHRMQAPPEIVWRCWQDPALLRRWFVPPPAELLSAEIDLRPGGRFRTAMRLPDGSEPEGEGCVLVADPAARLVWTDTLAPGFRPMPGGFMVVDITLTAQDGGTLYRAHVMHPDATARAAHEKMGFAEGWGTTLEQLDALSASLAG